MRFGFNHKRPNSFYLFRIRLPLPRNQILLVINQGFVKKNDIIEEGEKTHPSITAGPATQHRRSRRAARGKF
jgi:hypothetical protein